MVKFATLFPYTHLQAKPKTNLIFTSQPNLITDSDVHSSLHSNCRHQIVFTKFNLHILYPLPYLREIWHYRKGNTRLIRRAIKEFNWERAFSNTNVNEKVDIFNRTILNILSNFIPHETIVCNDKDPPWFNNRIKTLIQEKNAIRYFAITKIILI